MISQSTLARAYELHCTTDLEIAEIARALLVPHGALDSELRKALEIGAPLAHSRRTIQHQVLDVLKKTGGGLRHAAICEKASIDYPSFIGAIRALKKKGLVKARKCRVDRRKYIYEAVLCEI